MKLYEIVKTDITERFPNGYLGKPSVITATMDKEMAEEMLFIYRQNCGENEEYDIRVIQASYKDKCEHCLHCNSFHKCIDTIHLHPDTIIRCIRFGELKQYVKRNDTK